ncbi:MAG: hypothetical protein IJP72_07360 [Bacteroidales bacterium]|nr:hypothetical protein [Bacteroidales bacterium]
MLRTSSISEGHAHSYDSYEGDYPSSATWSYQYVEGDERHSVSMTTIYEYE